jgi:hypothetical protein
VTPPSGLLTDVCTASQFVKSGDCSAVSRLGSARVATIR